MSIEIKRKTIKFGIIILVALILGIVGVFATKTVIRNLKINEIKNKLSVIDCNELQKKIEEELMNTKLNLGNHADDLMMVTIINEGIEFDGYTCMTTILSKGIENIIGVVEMPCFKIERDNNGNFKNIEYTYSLFENKCHSTIIRDVIMKVFKDNYEIDFNELGKDDKVRNMFFKNGVYTNEGKLYIHDNNFFIGVLNNATNMNLEYGDSIKGFDGYITKTFGM